MKCTTGYHLYSNLGPTQWRSQGGAHWGTGPTNLVLCPTKLFLVRIKNSYVAILLHYTAFTGPLDD